MKLTMLWDGVTVREEYDSGRASKQLHQINRDLKAGYYPHGEDNYDDV